MDSDPRLLSETEPGVWNPGKDLGGYIRPVYFFFCTLLERTERVQQEGEVRKMEKKENL